MIKKLNILVLLLIILLSIGVVSASDDVNATNDNANSDILEISDVSEDNAELTAASHTINQNDYSKYFDSKGNLINNAVNSGDTVYLNGSFSNSKFTFDKKVNIIGTSSNDMKNTMITLTSGASGSSIASLNIANTNDETYGIFLNSASYCTIKDCNIVNTGRSSYCICVANGANYNNVTDNDLKAYGITYGHGSNSRSTPPLILSGSHYNYVANNHVEADDANGIYLSSYSGGPLKGGNSNFNTIYNNLVHYNVLPTSWAYGIQVMGNNNTIEANTVIKGYRGVSTAGYGNTIVKNKIINLTGADYNHPGVESGGEYGIVASYGSYVANNEISGAKVISTGAGISAIDNSTVENNLVQVTLKGRGIVAAGSNVIIRNNDVFTESGSGIYEKDEGSGLLVEGNNITSESGVGILIEKLSSTRMPKNVTIKNNVISTNNKYAIDVAGVQADSSEIDYDSNTIIGEGLINSPAGVIDTSKPTYIFKGKTHSITPDNIRTYINDNGGLTSEINDGDILSFSGSFSNEVIYVTKPVKITGKNPIFYNSTFKVTSGNVLIENLTIINKYAERVNAWGIFVNQAPGVRIMNNNISVNDPKAAYAVYVLESSDVDVWNNYLASEGDFLTFTLLSYSSERCNFANNTVNTVGTGDAYKFSPEKCIDGNELVINGRSYCLDGNEVVIDGTRYCLDGNELFINGVSYCLDGNEVVIDGTSYCLDGNEFVIDGTKYCIDGNELVIDGTKYCIDGDELYINGVSYCLDGNEVVIDGTTYCLDGNEFVIDGTKYCIDGNEVFINGVSYCLDGNELVIDGTNYCLDGNELVINGTTYCVDGNEPSTSGFHVVSEIYQTYGILLLYSSNNLISGNDVKVTSNLDSKYSTTGDESSQNSLVGIDLYFNCHNNTVSNNNVFVKGNDNYIYGVGVLGYYTGHTAPEGQGATNNTFKANQITLEGIYCVEGVIIGDESEDTLIEGNVINAKSECVNYGIYFEMSQKSTVKNNNLTLNAEVIYGIIGYDSNDNIITNNDVVANANDVYGVLISNGKNNVISKNKIKANGNGKAITFMNLDSLGYGNAGVYLKSNSTSNSIEDNEITTLKGYAVLLDSDAINNIIYNNYLVGENTIGNKAVSNSKNNNVSENYKYIAVPSISAVNVPYLGTGNFILTFGKEIDGAVVKFFDVDNYNFAQATVSNGVAKTTYEFDETYAPAQYSFTAKLSKENYKSSTYNIKVTVLNSNLVIDMKDISVDQGSKANIIANVVDELGNPIKGINVKFNRINSANRATLMGSAKTDENGIATLVYNTASLTVASYVITAEVTGADNYNDANTSATLKVFKPVVISNGKNYAVYYGNTVKYKIKIVGADGKAVVGEKVTFKINNKTKTVVSDKNGYATYSVKLSAGKYTITTQCGNAKKSNTITFKPTLIAKDISKKKAKSIKFTVKLVNKNGKILKNKKITFKMDNKKYTAKTNNKGVATLTLKNLKVGKHTIKSTYSGCTIKNTIQIKK